MTAADAVGWISSAILIATLVRQVHTQATRGPGRLSRWLFAGQIAASVGFLTYSVMLDNLVFIVSNTVILLTAIVGEWLTLRAERRAPR
jgi:MtN3 and saliva related transmembrane protein